MVIDRHTLALINIAGSSLDVVGALYLAYDLLGGEHGPLRTLTRAVTYGVLFGLGFGFPLGLVFGVACGITHGVTLAWEYSRVSKHKPTPGIWYDLGMSAIRGIGYAIGGAHLFGPVFGATFAALSTVGQTVAYRFGIRPTMDYAPGARLRITRGQFLAAVNRTFGYAAAGFLSAVAAHRQDVALVFGLKVGLVMGLVTTVLSACTPLVEWTADHMPPRRMGVVGVTLILAGFTLQSLQYWLTLFDIVVK